MNSLNPILYGVLGLVLGLSGVSVIDEPLKFISILLIVVLIDLKPKFG